MHWYRNIFSHVPSTKVREIAAMLKAIHASEDIAAARETGLPLIVHTRDAEADTLAILADHGVTNFAAAPTVYRSLRGGGLATPPGLALRAASSAGEPPPSDV